MLITIEGAPLTGKTTLARSLQKVWDSQANHAFEPITELVSMGSILELTNLLNTPSPGFCLEQHALPLSSYTPRPSANNYLVLLDSSYVSTEVASTLEQGHSALTPAQRIWLDMYYTAHGSLSIYLKSSAATVINRARHLSQDLPTRALHNRIDRYTMDCLDRNVWRTVCNDSSEAAEPTNCQRLLSHAAKLELLAARALQAHHGYVGSLRPRTLLVSTEWGAAGSQKPSFGTHTPWPDSPGEFLLNALISARIAHRGKLPPIGMASARESGTCLTQLWRCLGTPPVIALGPDAQQSCKREGIPLLGDVVHPWYMRTHHQDEMYMYGLALRGLILEATAA